MKENTNHLDGITIDGVHAEEWIVRREKDEKRVEIERERIAAITIPHSSGKVYLKPAVPKGGPRVSRRVKRFTDREIRKEYGIMAKPFGSVAANLIYAIIENGPLDGQEMAEVIEYEGGQSSISASLSTIWHRLGADGAGIIERESHSGKYRYQKKPGIDISVEAAIEKFNIIGRKQAKQKREAARSEEGNGVPAVTVDDESSAVSRALEETIKRIHGINIQVSGKVEVVFKLG